MPAPWGKWSLAGKFDRTIRPYLLVLTLILAASFLAGTIAPASIRRQMTGMFQAVVSNYQGLAGGMLFFNILVQNVMATIFVLIRVISVPDDFFFANRGVGLWISLAAAIAVILGGLLQASEEL